MPKLVQFTSTDNLLLPGLLYQPINKTGKAAIFLHGNGNSSVFYSVLRTNEIGMTLNKKGIAYFPFNNRGALYYHSLDKFGNRKKTEVKSGTAFELIKECIYDIDGAVSFLKQKGYHTFYLVGHSTGANKIVLYQYLKPKNPFSKFVLLGGGDDTGLYLKDMGKVLFGKILSVCKKKIQEGKGKEFVNEYKGAGLISYQSLYDTINPDGDYNMFPFNEYFHNHRIASKKLFREYRHINKPTLVIYGGKDEYCYGRVADCSDVLRKECSRPDLFDFHIIENSDHGFHGKENELAKILADWLVS